MQGIASSTRTTASELSSARKSTTKRLRCAWRRAYLKQLLFPIQKLILRSFVPIGLDSIKQQLAIRFKV